MADFKSLVATIQRMKEAMMAKPEKIRYVLRLNTGVQIVIYSQIKLIYYIDGEDIFKICMV